MVRRKAGECRSEFYVRGVEAKVLRLSMFQAYQGGVSLGKLCGVHKDQGTSSHGPGYDGNGRALAPVELRTRTATAGGDVR